MALLDYVTQFKNTLSAASIATAVWASASRPITKSGFTPIAAENTALAGNATVDLRPAAGVWRDLFITGSSGATTYNFGIYDGATFQLMVALNGSPCFSGAPGTAGNIQISGYATVGAAIRNATATPGTFSTLGADQPL